MKTKFLYIADNHKVVSGEYLSICEKCEKKHRLYLGKWTGVCSFGEIGCCICGDQTSLYEFYVPGKLMLKLKKRIPIKELMPA